MTPTGYITRKEAAELSGASETAINKAIEQKVIPTRRLKAGSLLDARDVGALALFSSLTSLGLPIKQKKRLRSWLRTASTKELPLSDALVVRRTKEIDDAIRLAQRYVELRKRYLVRDPRIRGGEPVIRGTRVPIRGLAKQIDAGETLEALREDYPNIPDEAFEFSKLWARANPRRGRPAPLWKVEAKASEPAGRTALVEARKRRSAAPSKSRKRAAAATSRSR